MNARAPELPTDLPDGNPHYVQAVTELGEEQAVEAHADIYASNGIKLVAKGTLVNRSLFERLSNHKLKVPLDLQLSAAKQLDGLALAKEAKRMLEEDQAIQRFAYKSGDPEKVRDGFSKIRLQSPLNFRLTVMHSQRKELFNHSLRCALLAHSLAISLQLCAEEQEAILVAAISHDLGEMHTDPALLLADRKLAADDRRFIHVHPITGYVLLRELDTLPESCLNAVLQHHERLDGSGYPYGLRNTRISKLGRLMAVVEVMEPVMRRHGAQRLDVMLRLNQSRFDLEIVNELRYMMREEFKNDEAPADRTLLLQFDQVKDVLDSWARFSELIDLKSAEGTGEGKDLEFLAERMGEFRSLILRTGIDINDFQATLTMVREDAMLLHEMHSTFEELNWRMGEIADEIGLKKPKLSALNKVTLQNFVDTLRPRAGVEQ